MIDLLIRITTEFGPSAHWLPIAVFVMVCAFVTYVGAAMVATFSAHDPVRASTCHEVLRDLLRLFRRGRP